MLFAKAFPQKTTPSTENVAVVDTNREYEPAKPTKDPAIALSPDASAMIVDSAVNGIVKAFARKMFMSGTNKDETIEKINEFVDLVRKNGDITRERAVDLKGNDYFITDDANPDRVPVFCNDFDMWSYENSIVAEALCTSTWVTEWVTREYKDKLTENERSILDNFEKTRRAYLDALNIRDTYFLKKSKALVADLLAKYEQPLTALDGELYRFLAERLCGMTRQPVDENPAVPAN